MATRCGKTFDMTDKNREIIEHLNELKQVCQIGYLKWFWSMTCHSKTGKASLITISQNLFNLLVSASMGLIVCALLFWYDR